jgi:hypothetical protein
MKSLLSDLLMATVFSLVYLVLAWSFSRSVTKGAPLWPLQKKMLLYTFIFALGMSYLMALAGNNYIPKNLMFPAIGTWAVVVAFAAWLRYHLTRR